MVVWCLPGQIQLDWIAKTAAGMRSVIDSWHSRVIFPLTFGGVYVAGRFPITSMAKGGCRVIPIKEFRYQVTELGSVNCCASLRNLPSG